jgi:hypothetical protein
VLDGLETPSRPRSHDAGVTQSRLLSPTTLRSSSTQVTLDAPTPSPAGTYRVRTHPRPDRGHVSSLAPRRPSRLPKPSLARPPELLTANAHTGNAGYVAEARWAATRCSRASRSSDV